MTGRTTSGNLASGSGLDHRRRLGRHQATVAATYATVGGGWQNQASGG